MVVTHTAEVNEAGTELKGTWRLTSRVMEVCGDRESNPDDLSVKRF